MSTARMATNRARHVPKRPEDRFNDLLTAAIDTFRRIGLESATVSDITERAGVAKGTFYLYFPSKYHVLGVIWDQYVDGFLARAAELFSGDDPDRDWRSLLDRAVDSLVRHALAHTDLHQMVYRSANARALELCRHGNDRAISMLSDAVRRANEAGQLDVADPETATRFIYHGLHGLLDDIVTQDAAVPGSVNTDAIVARATELSRRVLGWPGSAAEAAERPADDLGQLPAGQGL